MDPIIIRARQCVSQLLQLLNPEKLGEDEARNQRIDEYMRALSEGERKDLEKLARKNLAPFPPSLAVEAMKRLIAAKRLEEAGEIDPLEMGK